jgi:hypothetical protein
LRAKYYRTVIRIRMNFKFYTRSYNCTRYIVNTSTDRFSSTK